MQILLKLVANHLRLLGMEEHTMYERSLGWAGGTALLSVFSRVWLAFFSGREMLVYFFGKPLRRAFRGGMGHGLVRGRQQK